MGTENELNYSFLSVGTSSVVSDFGVSDLGVSVSAGLSSVSSSLDSSSSDDSPGLFGIGFPSFLAFFTASRNFFLAAAFFLRFAAF